MRLAIVLTAPGQAETHLTRRACSELTRLGFTIGNPPGQTIPQNVTKGKGVPQAFLIEEVIVVAILPENRETARTELAQAACAYASRAVRIYIITHDEENELGGGDAATREKIKLVAGLAECIKMIEATTNRAPHS